jgi:hypothetical protein
MSVNPVDYRAWTNACTAAASCPGQFARIIVAGCFVSRTHSWREHGQARRGDDGNVPTHDPSTTPVHMSLLTWSAYRRCFAPRVWLPSGTMQNTQTSSRGQRQPSDCVQSALRVGQGHNLATSPEAAGSAKDLRQGGLLVVLSLTARQCGLDREGGLGPVEGLRECHARQDHAESRLRSNHAYRTPLSIATVRPLRPAPLPSPVARRRWAVIHGRPPANAAALPLVGANFRLESTGGDAQSAGRHACRVRTPDAGRQLRGYPEVA